MSAPGGTYRNERSQRAFKEFKMVYMCQKEFSIFEHAEGHAFSDKKIVVF
jgi:hypothetical protein